MKVLWHRHPAGTPNPWHRHPACEPANHRQDAQAMRTGAVSLMLVLVLTMMVGTFAVSLSGRAVQQRRAEIHHQSIELLESAIEAADQANFSGDTTLRLPLDEASGRWIVVETISQESDPRRQYRATQYKNDQPGLSIQRIMNHQIRNREP